MIRPYVSHRIVLAVGPGRAPVEHEIGAVVHEDGARVQLLFRPEQVALFADTPPDDLPVLGRGEITEQNFTGPLRRVRLRVPRKEHDSGSVAVDAVDHEQALAELPLQPLLEAGFGRLAARRDHRLARRLVDGDDVLVLVEQGVGRHVHFPCSTSEITPSSAPQW